MKYPKEFDGVSMLGRAAIRSFHDLGLPVGTTLTKEVREDGTLGDVEAKRCFGFNEVHRSGGSGLRLPFICTWQSAFVTVVDRELPFKVLGFQIEPEADPGYLFFVSNSAYVGDGFSLGIVATKNGYQDECIFAPLLMRLPAMSPAIGVETYLTLDAVARRKQSVILDPVPCPSLDTIYVVPMGWKNAEERYAFAVVLNTLRVIDTDALGRPVKVPVPQVWLGNTGTMVLTALASGMGLDWAWDWKVTGPGAGGFFWQGATIVTSRLTCTAPGRLEMIVYKPESEAIVQTTQYPESSFPFFYNYAPRKRADGILPPPPTEVAGLPLSFATRGIIHPFPGYPGPPFPVSPGPTTNVITPTASTTGQAIYSWQTLAGRRPSMYLASSTDFGQTWVLTNSPALEGRAQELAPAYSQPVPGLVALAGSYAWQSEWPDATSGLGLTAPFGYPVALTEDEGVTYDTTDGPVTWIWTYTYDSIGYPQETIPIPQGTMQDSRGAIGTGRNVFLLAGAGSMTFALVGGYAEDSGPLIDLRGSSTQGDFFDILTDNIVALPDGSLVSRNPQRPLHPIPSESLSERAGGSRCRMFVRRDGESDFQRIAWLGDSLTKADLPTYGWAEYFPTEVLDNDLHQLAGSWIPTFTAGWCSTGEGKVAFFLNSAVYATAFSPGVVGESVTLVGTVDGGQSWSVLEIPGTKRMEQYCVIGRDDQDKGSCIIYSIPSTTKPGHFQLMRVASDLSKVTPYGQPYLPSAGGLLNFKRYVHPGFPGAYDDPES